MSWVLAVLNNFHKTTLCWNHRVCLHIAGSTIACTVHILPCCQVWSPWTKEGSTWSNDCGLFAFSTAVSLCDGEDPPAHLKNQSLMRKHCVSCLENLLVFPTQPWNQFVQSEESRMPVHRCFDVACSPLVFWKNGRYLFLQSVGWWWVHRQLPRWDQI